MQFANEYIEDLCRKLKQGGLDVDVFRLTPKEYRPLLSILLYNRQNDDDGFQWVPIRVRSSAKYNCLPVHALRCISPTPGQLPDSKQFPRDTFPPILYISRVPNPCRMNMERSSPEPPEDVTKLIEWDNVITYQEDYNHHWTGKIRSILPRLQKAFSNIPTTDVAIRKFMDCLEWEMVGLSSVLPAGAIVIERYFSERGILRHWHS